MVSLDPTVRITLVGMVAMQFFWNLCANASDQAAAQRYLSTPTIADARRSVWVFTMLNLCLTVLLMLCGLALFAFYSARSGLSIETFQQQVAPKADKLMPMFIARELPPGLSGLLLAALLSAAMSSISSGVNSISSVVVTDLWKGRKSTSLLLDKTVAAIAGVLGIGVAMLMAWSVQLSGWNLYELTSRVNNLLTGPMAILFLAAILLPRSTPIGALAGFLVGTLVAIAVSFGGLLGLEKPISFTWLVPASFLSGMLITALATGRSPSERQESNLSTSGA